MKCDIIQILTVTPFCHNSRNVTYKITSDFISDITPRGTFLYVLLSNLAATLDVLATSNHFKFCYIGNIIMFFSLIT